MGINLTGRNLVRDLVSGDSVLPVTHIAIGTGTTAFTDGDTILNTEVLRKTFDSFTSTASQTVYEMWIASTEANANSLTEAGIFNDDTAGSMLCRNLFTALAKDNTIEVLVEVKVVFSNEN